METIGSMAKKAVLKDTGKGPSLGNMYTGKKLTPLIGLGVAAMGIATAATRMGSASTSFDTGNDVDYLNQVDNLSFGARTKPTAPGASERGVAPSILAGGQNTSKADDMGATGDMVFGMHNKRHG